ncbi:MAG: response regulator [Candidatus Kapaibacterium sp.]
MRILCVDDEPVALAKLSGMLEKYGKVDKAENGKDAFDLFYKALYGFDPYELITIDIYMPEMHGLDLLAKIRSEESKFPIYVSKIVMVTAEGTADNVIQAAKSHVDAFIVKPIKKDVLAQKMEEIGLSQGK